MKFKITDLDILSGGVYSTLEEAKENLYDKNGRTGTVIVEMSEKEYCSLVSEYETKINIIKNYIKAIQQKNIESSTLLLNELNISKQATEKVQNEFKKLQKAFETEQQKVIYLENEVKALKKFVPISKSGPEKVNHNPYAFGLSFKIKPGLKKHIDHTDRSLMLLKHMKSCPVMTRLSAERLLNCSRKTATSVLKKLWIGGYLDLVTCIGPSDRFDVYYLPTLQTPKSANQVCQMAILSLLYVSLALSNSVFMNLDFFIRFERIMGKLSFGRNYSSNDYKEGDIRGFYIANISYIYTEKEKEFHRKLVAVPVRETDEKPSFILQDGEILFYIFPVSTDDEANSRVQEGNAYMSDFSLITNNISIGYK